MMLVLLILREGKVIEDIFWTGIFIK